MIEKHAFEIFVPANAKILILGSFSGLGAPTGSGIKDPAYDWYYGTKRNQFWPILEAVYGDKFRSRDAKKNLFIRNGIAIADIIYTCRRKSGTASDANLKIVEYNEKIPNIFHENTIEKILFTSRFTETKFRSHYRSITELYPTLELITLPSPSPRYARMNLNEKINKYKEAFLGI